MRSAVTLCPASPRALFVLRNLRFESSEPALLCRSPWSNEYDPPLEDGTVPVPKLRKLEIAANEAFDTYREMYFEGGASSVYLWDLEDGGFAGVVLFKKSG